MKNEIVKVQEMEINKSDFINVVNDIVKQIEKTKYEIFQNANMNLHNLYFFIGKILVNNSKYGNNFIDNLSIELKLKYPNKKGFSVRNLKNMRKYYLVCKKNEKVQKASALIPWSHNILIIDKIKDDDIRLWYINEAAINGWGYEYLEEQIKKDLYSRSFINNKPNNFSNTLDKDQSVLANEMMKDPYIFDITTIKDDYKERDLENELVDKIKMTLLELGSGFSFVGNQYRINIDNEDYYIDLLFYHLKLHCYIVIELKNSKFKPEYAGKMNFYLSAIDSILKAEKDNPSIGLILCKNKSKFTAQYALKDINKPIGISSYELTKYLPNNLINVLPNEEEINLHIDLEQSNN